MSRLPIVGVMGSGKDAYPELAVPLGAWLASQSVHLLTGGGRGVMESVSKAFFDNLDRRGSIIGVIPSQLGSVLPKDGYPNPWVEIPIYTHLPLSGRRGSDPLSRNHINILSSDAVIALPGRNGTLNEIQLALAYERPLVAFLSSRDQFPNLPSEVPVVHALGDLAQWLCGVLSKVRLSAHDSCPHG